MKPNTLFKRLRRRFAPSSSPPTLTSLDAYALWADSYPPHAHNPLMQAEQAAMTAMLPDLAGKITLDLACGTGRWGLLAAERGAAAVVGLDNSAAMLRRSALRQRALASLEALPLRDGVIDVALCGLALGHTPRLAAALGEISRVLRPGGCALVSDFHPLLYLAGKRRVFTTAGGQTYAVEHHLHLYSDYHRAARLAGLHIDDVAEPRLIADQAETAAPVVIVYRLVKPA